MTVSTFIFLKFNRYEQTDILINWGWLIWKDYYAEKYEQTNLNKDRMIIYFDMVVFYEISTLVGYLMRNAV